MAMISNAQSMPYYAIHSPSPSPPPTPPPTRANSPNPRGPMREQPTQGRNLIA